MTADFAAQLAMVVLMTLAATPEWRRFLQDCMDMNVERLERRDRDAAEAKAWLIAMGVWK